MGGRSRRYPTPSLLDSGVKWCGAAWAQLSRIASSYRFAFRPRSGKSGATQTISTGHFGSACMKARPQGVVTIRLSRITTIPRSVFVRIKRPTPCRSFKMASGKAANRNRVIITFESASPGTSTPLQKLPVPKRTLRGAVVD
jgi:hypothetical protein